ncbi:MAG: hypothetical protein L3K26_17210 [Candidatus Hydrogenedentes bacterium]|nr:hypothetical protein [Candidatus Hydrogenedentota bacterium]
MNQGIFYDIFTGISDGFVASLSAFVSGIILGLLNPLLTGFGFPEITV